MLRSSEFLFIFLLALINVSQLCKSAPGCLSCFTGGKEIETTLDEAYEYVEFSLTKIFRDGASDDELMNQIVLWQETETNPNKAKETEQFCRNEMISRLSCLEIIGLLVSMKNAEAQEGCPDAVFDLYNMLNSVSEWRDHSFNARESRVSMLDRLVHSYAMRFRQKCLPILAAQFNEENNDARFDLLKKVMRYIYTEQYKSLVDGSDGEQREFVIFTRRIVWPRSTSDLNFGRIIAGLITHVTGDSSAVVPLLQRYKEEYKDDVVNLVHTYLFNPCRRYYEKTDGFFDKATTVLDNREDILAQGNEDELTLLMGEAIYLNCLEMKNIEAVIEESLLTCL